MPNWCTNKLVIMGTKDVLDQIKAVTSIGELKFDFNGIVHMPESLRITKGSATENGKEALFGEWKRLSENELIKGMLCDMNAGMLPQNREEMLAIIRNSLTGPFKEIGGRLNGIINLDEAQIAHDNLKQFGFEDWYEWSIANWGTKWNVDQIHLELESDESIDFSFDTAWSPPLALIAALCEKFPQIEVNLKYGEAGNWFGGTAIGSDGVLVHTPAEDVDSFLEENFRWSLDPN